MQHATHPGDSITITANKDSQYQILNIKDTGSGIAPEHLDHVFDRFIK